MCAVNANNDGEKRWSLPGVLVAATGILTIVLVSLDPPLTLVSAMYISHGARSALVSQSLVIAQ